MNPPSTSATLWTHLLRLNPDDSRPFLPPTGPQDKNATTMRVLLHDTQTNLERFSDRVDALLSEVKETRQQMSTTSSLFEQEHDKLIGDMIDLVNRSQTLVQASVGSPAQASELTAYMDKMQLRLESLDQRIDAIQAFNQTHSQALHTQNQAIQTLQAQQVALLNSVTPLLPLLQTILSRLPLSHSRPQTSEPHSPKTSRKRPSPFSAAPHSTKKRQISHRSDLDSTNMVMESKARCAVSPSEGLPKGHVQTATPHAPKEPSTIDPFVNLNHSALAKSDGKAVSTPRRPLEELYTRPNGTMTLRSLRAGHTAGHAVLQQSPLSKDNAASATPETRQLGQWPNSAAASKTPITQADLLSARLRNLARKTPMPAATHVVPDATASPSDHRSLAAAQSRPLGDLNRRPLFHARLKEPIKEGKRFIPLVDTDDEDSE